MEQGAHAYDIFWEPYNPTSYSWYNWRLDTLFPDISQTGYFGDLTQYCDLDFCIPNASRLIASWQDTQVYPSTQLTSGQIETEVLHAISQNGWNVDSNSQINVFLGSNESLCGANTSSCGQCGWHAFDQPAQLGFLIAFTAIAYNNTCHSNVPIPGVSCPNSPSCDVDSALNNLSHETFEVASDPFGYGWYDSSSQEIGDKCAPFFKPLSYSGTANHRWGPSNGYRYYILQEEWDNAATSLGTGGGCTQYGPTWP
jgi:hypothetical protein